MFIYILRIIGNDHILARSVSGRFRPSTIWNAIVWYTQKQSNLNADTVESHTVSNVPLPNTFEIAMTMTRMMKMMNQCLE